MKLTDTARMVLVRAEVFMDLPTDYLASIRQYLEEQHLAAGLTVFREGETGDKLYVVRRGNVRLQRVRDGVLYEVGRRGPGDMLGETALIDSSPRNVTVVCVGECDFFTLSRDAFYEILAKHPAVATKILRVLTARIRDIDAARLQELEEKNATLEQARDRLKELLAHLESTNDQLEAALSTRDCFLTVSPYPVVLTDASHNVRLTNPAATRLFGDSHSRNIWAWLCPVAPEAVSTIEAALGAGDPWAGELELRGLDGRNLLCRATVTPIAGGGNEEPAGLWLLEDRTESRSREEQAIQRDRLAAKGEMAAEIAHELNNHLAVLSGNAELLEMHLGNGHPEKAGRCLNNIRQSLDRVRVFTDDMLSACHRGGATAQLDINSFLTNLVAFLRPQRTFKKVIFKTDLSSNLPPVTCNPADIQQAIYNLLLNSAEALAETAGAHSTIWIGTEYAHDDGLVRIRIADDGPGLAPKVRPCLFNQTVSSKPGKHGFGLLAVHRIVGRVAAGSGPNGGAEFIVEFPPAAPSRARSLPT
ncbi:MAG: cyclic nucleotide-binding domain-containing protein [candidate division Zixibacteria bacterium]|nr:cyclic nucleotide-binding domain-containing protein [candidate division Zixibacteria bacterium]